MSGGNPRSRILIDGTDTPPSRLTLRNLIPTEPLTVARVLFEDAPEGLRSSYRLNLTQQSPGPRRCLPAILGLAKKATPQRSVSFAKAWGPIGVGRSGTPALHYPVELLCADDLEFPTAEARIQWAG